MPCNAEQLATTLAESFQGVSYDKKKRTGTATIPNVGTIEFHESGNDPAVIINLRHTKRFKGSAETAVNFLETLIALWSDSD
jgi:hypothetical protein